MSFCPETPNGNPKIPKIGSPVILGAHNFVCKPPIKMIFRTNLYLSLRAFQRYVAHHLNVRKSRRFLIFNGHLTPNLSFGHNLCFKCQYGSCKTILDIYVSRAFQWYKKLFNPMGFNPYNYFLKIWESMGIPTPKVGAHFWECEGSYLHTLLHSQKHEMWFLGFFLGPHLCKPLPWSQASS
jgi:hypothetical protein